jgi:hypothetical protein
MDIKNLKKIMPILQAIVDGKTIQHKTINREWYDTNVASLDHLVTYYKDYRIKPEPTYRPFKDAEECWAEMQKHQPFGWVKDRNGSKFVIENVDSGGFVEVYDDGTCSFKEVFENRTFADGTPFGVKVEN